jgi:cold shock CspA family protein
MKLPLQISFHNVKRTDEIEDRIREEAAQLDQFCNCIMSCRIVIDVPHRHHETGNAYQIRIDIKVPGEEIAIVRQPSEHDPTYANLNTVMRDAFDSAARKLEDYVRRQRRDVKQHATTLHGRVSRVFPQSGYGFIESPDGLELYFHAHSVLEDKFEDVRVGTEVAYAEEFGDKGPQASTVRVVGRHGHA